MLPHTHQTKNAARLDREMSGFNPTNAVYKSPTSPPSDVLKLWRLSATTVKCERASIMQEFYPLSYYNHNSQRPYIPKLKQYPIYVIKNLLL